MYKHAFGGSDLTQVFIDGSAGTTGLGIGKRLAERNDIRLLTLPVEKRKDLDARAEMLNKADIAFLCLPDDAAREAVDTVTGDTVIIDTSTAHRTAPGWVYGFPELFADGAERIKSSSRIAVPGCHASGFIALIYPLIAAGIVSEDIKLSCNSLTGYSGGGKAMIKSYEMPRRGTALSAPRVYGITQNHKHLKEMKGICGLERAPLFTPTVSDFYSGMLVSVPMFTDDIKGGATAVKQVYSEKYGGCIVKYTEDADENGFLTSNALSGRDSMEISVFGNDERILLAARYDNLGKGASGAAVECLNILLDKKPETGLRL